VIEVRIGNESDRLSKPRTKGVSAEGFLNVQSEPATVWPCPSARGFSHSPHADDAHYLGLCVRRVGLAEDVAAALETHPQAAAFFDTLAQFYRRAFLRWIDATKRRPEQRPQRIVEMIELLEAGHKERPHQ
jgi:hypothetical protein